MINISNVVRETIEDDPVALASMASGYMNFSRYARRIHPLIERNLYQKVSDKSITVALSRIAKDMDNTLKQQKPRILNISLHTNLAEVSYEKTYDNLKKLAETRQLSSLESKNFFTSTSGVNEITLVGGVEIIERIEKEIMKTKPSFRKSNVVGITIKFPLEQLDTPGILMQLVQQVSRKEINLVEAISTNTELTLLVEKKDAEQAIAELTKLT